MQQKVEVGTLQDRIGVFATCMRSRSSSWYRVISNFAEEDSGPRNSFNGLGHFKHVSDDDDDNEWV